MLWVVAMVIGTVICASIVPIITVLIGMRKPNKTKIVYKFSKELFDAEFSKRPDEYEIDFEQRHKGQFIGRFDMDFLEFRNHCD